MVARTMAGFEIEREAFGILFREQAAFKDTYGGEEGRVFLEAYRIGPWASTRTPC